MAAHIIFSKKLPTLKQLPQLLMLEALKRARGNKAIAASMLGISQETLTRFIRSRGQL